MKLQEILPIIAVPALFILGAGLFFGTCSLLRERSVRSCIEACGSRGVSSVNDGFCSCERTP